jgi:regulator of protease activity HflC (stomatin/prohibitin superfamily)
VFFLFFWQHLVFIFLLCLLSKILIILLTKKGINKMKFFKFTVLLVFAVSMMGLTACSKVPAGNVGVKVNLLGGEKGVDTEELSPGRYWIGMNEELYIFPTFTQNYVWTKDPAEGSENDESISFQTVEGMSVGADVGISYLIQPNKVSNIFQKYRKGVNEITDIFLRNMVRDAFVKAASTKEVESVYGKGKSELLLEVEEFVRSQVKDIGITVERIYLVGDLRLPSQVVNALNMKIQATQQAQQVENEIRTANAAAEKKIADARGQAESILKVAKAQAEANTILAASITPELVKYKQIEKWNGTLPQVNGSGSIPMIDLKQP